MNAETQELIQLIQTSIIGDDRSLAGPFGRRRMIYADYTASGRALQFIEDYISNEVLPLYANTHTEASRTGSQTTRFREGARDIILEAVGGTDEDVVIFCGSGATGAIHKLIEILNICLPRDLEMRYKLSDQIPASERPVIFIGPYEHHSNEIPWRESIADVVQIAEDIDGQIDLVQLERELEKYAARELKIGSFSAASNVTGIVSDIAGISQLLHRHDALAFWDFAAAAPYVDIEMNLPLEGAYKDAIFISPHKFIGGPGTPGVLVVKRNLLKNTVPSVPGGGTVSYVSPAEHTYLTDAAHREEGGTPAIVEAIRAGLVFHLKQAVSAEVIEELEQTMIKRAISEWSVVENLQVLGNIKAKRLSIVSFVIKHGEKVLHHNFVVALLNDLFGIQTRGGCSCAGPYGHRLLGIDLAESMKFHEAIEAGGEGIKPGWVRLNFNYFISEEAFLFIIAAIKFVARDGWRFLPDYHFCAKTGRWQHCDQDLGLNLRLEDIQYQGGHMQYVSDRVTESESAFAQYLTEAETLAADRAGCQLSHAVCLPPELEALRWFPMAVENTKS
ncbi:MAG: selenocysteine lyase/cysteine desulfurase [Candidatus Krumholzibacteriia bacterium]